MKISRSSLKQTIFRIGAIAMGLAAALFLGEALARMTSAKPAFAGDVEMPWMQKGGVRLRQIFTLDPELGFRPVLGTKVYNEWGTLVNDYSLEKPPGKTRLLYIGDSVTARGKLIDALRQLYGEEKYEYWNGGVESFSPPQEVAFYEQYQSKISPDKLIVTFVMNDFAVTPIAFLDEQGALVVYSPRARLRPASRILYRYSRLYQIWMRITVSNQEAEKSIVKRVTESIRRLRQLSEQDGQELIFIVMPFLRPPDEWTEREETQHRRILELLEAENIEYYDLKPALPASREAEANFPWPKEDFIHPNDEISQRFAQALWERRILPDEPQEPAPQK